MLLTITLALVVACIAAYRALFVQAKKARRQNLKENPLQQDLHQGGQEKKTQIKQCAAERSELDSHEEDV